MVILHGLLNVCELFGMLSERIFIILQITELCILLHNLKKNDITFCSRLSILTVLISGSNVSLYRSDTFE